MVKEINAYVKLWENRCYKQGIPDSIPDDLDRYNLVPNYKTIAMAIFKNDVEILGVKPKHSKYYSLLKKIEIESRPGFVKQLSLFDYDCQ